MTGKEYQVFYDSFDDLVNLQDMLPFFVDFDKIPFEVTYEHSMINAYWLSEFCRLSYITSQGKIQEECKKVNMEVQFVWVNNIEFLVAYDDIKVFVVARGTETSQIDDIIVDLKAYRLSDSRGEIHAGFKQAVDLVWDQLREVIFSICKDKKIFYAGHSLGAGLATVVATKLGGAGLYTFGSPRVGNIKFALYSDISINHFRYVNQGDLFAAMPPPIFGWRHFGKVIVIRSDVFVNDNTPVKGFVDFLKKKLLGKVLLLFSVSKWALLDLVAEHNVLTYNNYFREQLNLPPHKIPQEYLDQVGKSFL